MPKKNNMNLILGQMCLSIEFTTMIEVGLEREEGQPIKD